MKNRIIILISFLTFFSLCGTNYQNKEIIAVNEQKQPQIENLETILKTDWDFLIEAIIWVESRGNKNAIGQGNCVGILQLTKIYVREANRLLKTEKYTYEDRFDSLKSIEMFTLIQSHYNPEKEINKAIYFHNKKAGTEYSNKIKNRIKYLKTI